MTILGTFSKMLDTGFLKFFYHALSGVGLTALRAEGYGRLSAAGCVRFAQGAGRKVLRIDRPAAGGFLSLTAFQAEGCGIALRAMSIKSALRDVLFCVIWHDKHSADWLAALASPYPASPDFPPPASGGRIKHRETLSS